MHMPKALAAMFLPFCLFSLPVDSSAQTFSLLHTFANIPDGAKPESKLLTGQNGNVYGVTYNGGTNGQGTIFRLNNNGITILHNFGVGQSDGKFPLDNSGLIRDQAGNLYGTTTGGGGKTGSGTVFKLNILTNKLTILHAFSGKDGRIPNAGLSMDASGNLFGTTYAGGGKGLGTIFEITASGDFSTLYSFPSAVSGYEPTGGVVLDTDGNLYGATRFGGMVGYGTIFKLDTSDTLTTLHNFSGTDGGNVDGGLIRDQSGNLYGASASYGLFVYGNIFKLDAAGQLTVLYSFTCEQDGCYPFTELVMDGSGNLYGTTEQVEGSKYGTVFELSPSGVETVLYQFTDEISGAYPVAGVTMDSAGNLYGTAADGGLSGNGTVFEITP
jgi:uncharacterized repeat protein (TIGR03803 family)